VRGDTHSISESDLKDCSIFLCQLPCYSCMTLSELQKTSKEGISGNFWQILDFGGICSIEVSDDEKYGRDDGNADCLERHDSDLAHWRKKLGIEKMK
jgi:hypothetical protein